LSAWRNDSREALKKADTDTTLNMAALFQIAKDTIHLLNKASPEPQDKRWFQLLRSVQEMPRLRSIKYRKPVTALENMLQQTSETKEQADAVIALHRHLQRGIVYDG
jgi:phage repressor protein C with HTH and peptisase S24 domain